MATNKQEKEESLPEKIEDKSNSFDQEEANYFQTVIAAFANYEQHSIAWIEKLERSFYKLPPKHRVSLIKKSYF
jgi:hypothetical protein